MGFGVHFAHASETACVCWCGGPEGFALTSPGGSARLLFPWRTQASFEANEADWSSPSARSGSQTAPGGGTPDNPVNQGEEKGEDKFEWVEQQRGSCDRFHMPLQSHKTFKPPLLIKMCLEDCSGEIMQQCCLRGENMKRRMSRKCQVLWVIVS